MPSLQRPALLKRLLAAAAAALHSGCVSAAAALPSSSTMTNALLLDTAQNAGGAPLSYHSLTSVRGLLACHRWMLEFAEAESAVFWTQKQGAGMTEVLSHSQ